LGDRVSMLVDARLKLHSTVAPVARLVRRRLDNTPDTADLKQALSDIRAVQSSQVRRHFAQELAGRSQVEVDDLVDTVAALTSFEAWDLLQASTGRSQAQIRRAWRSALLTLLS
jgi:hypothetical protein